MIARIAAARIATYAEEKELLSENQFGFRKGRSMNAVIPVFRIILEITGSVDVAKKLEWDPLVAVFAETEKSYGRLSFV